MTTIGMYYDVLPSKEGEFKNGFAAVVAALTKTTGHVESRLFEDVAEPGRFMILSKWNSADDFQAFIRSEAFTKVTDWGKRELLRSRPVHRVYNDA